MASSLNEESVERKLHAVTNTQDGIQIMSLWIIHHKVHHKKIVDLWLKVLKKDKTSHRLTLFHLCNDVVQNCKKKQAKIYMDTFKHVLKDAAYFVRDASIRSNVNRIFSIWEERNVYDSSFTAELKEILENDNQYQPQHVSQHRRGHTSLSPKLKSLQSKLQSTKVQSTKMQSSKVHHSKLQQQPAQQSQTAQVDEKAKSNHMQILDEFKTQKMLEKVASVTKLESEGELKFVQLSTLRLDVSNLEAVKQLKDRAHGKEFSRQFEDACHKLDDYVGCLQREIEHRTAMITMLEQSELFYEDQYQEAKIVANAYKNFGSRVAIVKKKLDELKLSLPDPASPLPSPTPDAPSPSSTPPADVDTQQDNTEAIDMELSDSDNDDNDASRNILERKSESSPKSASSVPPTSPDSNCNVDMKDNTEESCQSPLDCGSSQPSSESNSLEKRIASMLPNLPMASSISSPVEDMQRQQQPLTMSSSSSSSSSKKEHRYHSDRKHVRSSSDVVSDDTPDWLDHSPVMSSRSTTSPSHSSHKSSHRKLPSNSSLLNSTSLSRVSAYNSPPLSNDEGSSTPLNDEGGSTPVQDEKEEQTTRENPIDFLTKLINQTQKSPKTSTASFLQNLMNTGMKPFTPSYDDNKGKDSSVDLSQSALPPQIPPPPMGPGPVSLQNQPPSLQTPSSQHNQTTSAQSWAAWKAKRGPSDDLPNLITTAPPPPPPSMPPPIISPQRHDQVGLAPIPQRPDLSTMPPMMGPPPPPDHLPGMSGMPPLPPDSIPSVAPVPPPDCLLPGMAPSDGIPPPSMPPPMQPPDGMNMPRRDQMVLPGGIPGIPPSFHPPPPESPITPQTQWKHDLGTPYCGVGNAADHSDGYNSSPQNQTSPEPCTLPLPWMNHPPPPHDTSIPPPVTLSPHPPPPHARSLNCSVLPDYPGSADNISAMTETLQGSKTGSQSSSPNRNGAPGYTGRVNRVLSQSDFPDDQREFIEKLKRKSSNLVTPPIVDSLPDSVSNVRNLTAVKLEDSPSNSKKSGDSLENTESNHSADIGACSGQTEDDEEEEGEQVEEEERDEVPDCQPEEPKGAPILTVSGIAARRYEPERLRIGEPRGDNSRRTDSLNRRFEQPIPTPLIHRHPTDTYRVRRRADRDFYRNTPYPTDPYGYPYTQDWHQYYAQTNQYMAPPLKRPYEPYNPHHSYYPSKY
ncbi:regulation of nuclear pre-mRNA domain-containing protein 2-like isoform X2 [Argonauta hians]